jgi:hypothetical protein
MNIDKKSKKLELITINNMPKVEEYLIPIKIDRKLEIGSDMEIKYLKDLINKYSKLKLKN